MFGEGEDMRTIFFIGAILIVIGLWLTFSTTLVAHFAETETVSTQQVTRYPLLLAEDMVVAGETESVRIFPAPWPNVETAEEELPVVCDPVEMEEAVEPVRMTPITPFDPERKSTNRATSLGRIRPRGSPRNE